MLIAIWTIEKTKNIAAAAINLLTRFFLAFSIPFSSVATIALPRLKEPIIINKTGPAIFKPLYTNDVTSATAAGMQAHSWI